MRIALSREDGSRRSVELADDRKVLGRYILVIFDDLETGYFLTKCMECKPYKSHERAWVTQNEGQYSQDEYTP